MRNRPKYFGVATGVREFCSKRSDFRATILRSYVKRAYCSVMAVTGVAAGAYVGGKFGGSFGEIMAEKYTS